MEEDLQGYVDWITQAEELEATEEANAIQVNIFFFLWGTLFVCYLTARSKCSTIVWKNGIIILSKKNWLDMINPSRNCNCILRYNGEMQLGKGIEMVLMPS